MSTISATPAHLPNPEHVLLLADELSLPVAKIATYRESAPEQLRIDPYLGTYFFRLNTTRNFLADPRVRRALSLSIDRVAIVEKILGGGQIAHAAFTPRGTGGYNPPEAPLMDTDRARTLLAEAGFPSGENAPTVEILFNTSENHKLVAEAIQAMWRRGLGLNIELLDSEAE